MFYLLPNVKKLIAHNNNKPSHTLREGSKGLKG